MEHIATYSSEADDDNEDAEECNRQTSPVQSHRAATNKPSAAELLGECNVEVRVLYCSHRTYQQTSLTPRQHRASGTQLLVEHLQSGDDLMARALALPNV